MHGVWTPDATDLASKGRVAIRSAAGLVSERSGVELVGEALERAPACFDQRIERGE